MTNKNLSSFLLLWNTARNNWWEGKENLEIPQPQILMFAGRENKTKKLYTTCSKGWQRKKKWFVAISPLILWDSETQSLVVTADLAGSKSKCTEHLLTFPCRESYKASAKNQHLYIQSPTSAVLASPSCGYSYCCPSMFSVPHFSYSSTSSLITSQVSHLQIQSFTMAWELLTSLLSNLTRSELTALVYLRICSAGLLKPNFSAHCS